MAHRRLKITKSTLENVNYLWLGAFRLRVDVADDGSGADPKVFLFQRRPVNPTTEDTLDEFLAIASPVDMAEYPPDAPDNITTYPFFRQDWIEVDFRATEQAEAAYGIIVEEITALCQALDRMEQLVPVSVVYVGAPATGSSQSSASSLSG